MSDYVMYQGTVRDAMLHLSTGSTVYLYSSDYLSAASDNTFPCKSNISLRII